MILRRKILALVLCVAVIAPWPASSQAPPAERRPKLVVVLVVDQMRADYIEHYGHQWTKGLRRLLEHGAWFRLAAYPYANTVTCAGHATISTGAFPATHGIVQNIWWDREAGKVVGCADDPQAKTISYNKPDARAEFSGWRLLVPTLADELRAQSAGTVRVATISLKQRTAVMLAGHRGDAVTWADESSGSWVTSSAFSAAPVPVVQQFVNANPVERDFDKVWTRRLPEDKYLFTDDGEGENPPPGWTKKFPHPLKRNATRPDAAFYAGWAMSPYADDYLGAMAQAVADGLELGRHGSTDFLAISFSTLDLVGHSFGPKSHEVQDVLIRLDATLGKLFERLDKTVGAGNYVVAFSADHGVAPLPEQEKLTGVDAGRIPTKNMRERIEKALAPFLGEGDHVARVNYSEIYFLPGVYQKLGQNPGAMKAVTDAILSEPGVARVFRGEEMQEARNSKDPVARAMALSQFAGRSGDLLVVPKPYWMFSAPVGGGIELGTSHGTPYGYDMRVPLILMGGGIQSGEYLSASSPVDIAPTLAFLCGITLPHADGRVLSEALAAGAALGQVSRPATKKP